MIFDTGSSWVWVQHDLCKTCANEAHFNSMMSTTFEQLTPNFSSLFYGKGMVIGYDTTDQLCLTQNSTVGNGCMENYHFKSIVYQEDLDGLATAGIIGLAPSSQGTDSQLWVPSLYKAGAIKQNVFSMFIDQGKTSKIQVGGYDEKKYAIEDLKWYKLISDEFWQFNFDHVSIGDFKIQPTVQIMMADTGTSLNMLPDADYYKIVNDFLKPKFQNCEVMSTSLVGCDCTAEEHKTVPAIKFHINGDEFEIPRDSWFERVEGNGKCVVKFMHGPGKTYWILGLNFFNSYYTVFDYENQQIGFAKSIMYGHSVPLGFIQESASKGLANLKQFMNSVGKLDFEEVSPESKLLLGSATIAWALFYAYFMLIKKSKKDQLNTSVDSEETQSESSYRQRLAAQL